MPRLNFKWVGGTTAVLGVIFFSAYAGYRYGTIAQFQDSLFCTAGNTRTYVSALEGLSSRNVSDVVHLLEVNVDAGVILLTSTPDGMTTEPVAKYMKETLVLVRDHREKHPWTDGAPALKERVNRAPSKVTNDKGH